MMNKLNLLFVVLIVCLALLGSPIAAHAGGYVGCEVQYQTFFDTYGVITNFLGICSNPKAICRWIEVEGPFGEECYVFVCFGSLHTEAHYPVLVPTDDPDRVMVQCGQSESFPIYLRAMGCTWWDECAYQGICATYPQLVVVYGNDVVDDWINGRSANVGFVTLRCRC